MRVLCLVILAACGRANFEECGTPHDSPAAMSGLELYLTFDGSDLLADASGNHHDATCSSCPLAVGGRVGGGAAAFSGTQCLHVADAQSLRPSSFTFAGWASTAGVQNGSVVWRAYNGATSAGDAFGIGFGMLADTWGVTVYGASVNRPRQTGWHHYAGSFDGTKLTAYFDGAVVDVPMAATAVYADDDVTVGCQIDNGVEVFLLAGSLDDVRFYTRALTADEIAALASM